MKADYDTEARRRPVNLSLNEELVSQARRLTGNLSGVVESLLAGFVARERSERLAKTQAIDATVTMWNAFNVNTGSIADEYSSL